MRFFDALTCKQIGVGFLEIDPPSEAKQRQCVAITGDGAWGWGGGGFNGQQCNTSPVADGNRLYLRSNDNLYCIGLERQ